MKFHDRPRCPHGDANRQAIRSRVPDSKLHAIDAMFIFLGNLGDLDLSLVLAVRQQHQQQTYRDNLIATLETLSIDLLMLFHHVAVPL